MKEFSAHPVRLLALALISVAILAIGADPAPAQYLLDRAAPALDRNIASQTAPKTGPRSRYRTLVRKLEAPDDRTTFGDFYDYGYWAGTSYLGQNDLPPGYWVYLAPNWYIFKEDATSSSTPPVPRQWGPEQATGAPDTWPRSGDIGTAWASKTPDGQDEWLQLRYAAPIRPTAVLVYETFNPGALGKVTAVNEDGKETELWSGSDPTPANSGKGISVVPVHPESEVKTIKLYLNSKAVAGWNEIDAVGLVDETGKTHWATSATASSTYAQDAEPHPQLPIVYERLLSR